MGSQSLCVISDATVLLWGRGVSEMVVRGSSLLLVPLETDNEMTFPTSISLQEGPTVSGLIT